MTGVSVVAMSCPSFTSVALVRRIASVDMVGDVASSLEYMSYCLQLSAHPLAFTLPYCFPVINIREFSAALFCSCE
eukprot:13217813-Ditylum_brightwellii.AAC.1